MNFNIEEHIIFKGISGSHAYGMATPESDVDYRGIAIPPREYFLGPFKQFEQYESKPDPNDPSKEDSVMFDIRKFFSLAANSNPNILELLWLPEDCIVTMTPWMERIMAHRDKFLSVRVGYTYSGYAMAQLKRIKTHRAWLLNPVKRKPERADWNLPDNQDIAAFKKKVAEVNDAGLDAMQIFGDTIKAEAAYKNAHNDWESYQNWQKSRNPKRAALEAQFGYDSKHAAHLVRLMRQGYEMLTTGQVNVRRPDAEELLAIRNNGIWSYDELIEWAENMDAKVQAIAKNGSSPLPKGPDRNFLEKICIEVVQDFLDSQ